MSQFLDRSNAGRPTTEPTAFAAFRRTGASTRGMGVQRTLLWYRGAQRADQLVCGAASAQAQNQPKLRRRNFYIATRTLRGSSPPRRHRSGMGRNIRRRRTRDRSAAYENSWRKIARGPCSATPPPPPHRRGSLLLFPMAIPPNTATTATSCGMAVLLPSLVHMSTA